MALTTITAAMLAADLISDHTNIGAEPAGSDEVLLSDAGVLKAVTVTNLIAGAGGGKVLQVVNAVYSTQTTATSDTYTDTGLSLIHISEPTRPY